MSTTHKKTGWRRLLVLMALALMTLPALAQGQPGYRTIIMEDFTLIVSDEVHKHLDDSQYKRTPRQVLARELKTIVTLFRADVVTLLRKVPIVVYANAKHKKAHYGQAIAVYDPGQWPAGPARIVILRMRELTELNQGGDSGFSVILHELAHCVHHQLIGYDNLAVMAAFQQARERKLYDPKGYIMTNELEFFAEATQAYFGLLEYEPKTRADLKKRDPVTFKLMQNVWGNQKGARSN